MKILSKLLSVACAYSRCRLLVKIALCFTELRLLLPLNEIFGSEEDCCFSVNDALVSCEIIAQWEWPYSAARTVLL